MNLRFLTIAATGLVALSLASKQKSQEPSELEKARAHWVQCKAFYDACKAHPQHRGVQDAARRLIEARTDVIRLEMQAARSRRRSAA